MTTFNQLKYDILRVASGGAISDDTLISLRQIGFWIINTRAMLIRQDLDKKRSISDNIIQSLGCVPVTWVDAAQCCQLTVGCQILRTVDKIPKPIELSYRDLITRVGPVGVGKVGYSLIPYARAPFVSTKYNIPDAFYHDGYVFILNSPFIEYISVEGVFEDPTEVAKFSTCDGLPCYSDDDVFPISAHMIEAMKQIIMTTNIKTILSVPVDTTGDAKGKQDEGPATR